MSQGLIRIAAIKALCFAMAFGFFLGALALTSGGGAAAQGVVIAQVTPIASPSITVGATGTVDATVTVAATGTVVATGTVGATGTVVATSTAVVTGTVAATGTAGATGTVGTTAVATTAAASPTVEATATLMGGGVVEVSPTAIPGDVGGAAGGGTVTPGMPATGSADNSLALLLLALSAISLIAGVLVRVPQRKR